MSLTNKTIANSYKDILQVDNSNNGVGTSTKTIISGDGTSSSVQISDDLFQVIPQNDDTTATFAVMDKASTVLLRVDSHNSKVQALGNYVNTNVKGFRVSYGNSLPNAADTWTGVPVILGVSALSTTLLEMGASSGTPTDGLVVATDGAEDMQYYWYLPFDIAIDRVRCMFSSDTDTGSDVKFSIMAYDVVVDNGANSGNLSGGSQVCVSPTTVDANAGQVNIYFQDLTISTSDVDAGKVIICYVASDEVTSDLSVDIQMVYHLR